mmetsp:Transcript_33743/g.80695  ORF Transcript_33743/g.80695 Transcript_33743/m.80695 type:complete len:86 (-) Transcript_33743:83-340(-)
MMDTSTDIIVPLVLCQVHTTIQIVRPKQLPPAAHLFRWNTNPLMNASKWFGKYSSVILQSKEKLRAAGNVSVPPEMCTKLHTILM